ncbi:MAG: hypothetical protein AAGA54_27310 [Myxococcota bacterium]
MMAQRLAWVGVVLLGLGSGCTRRVYFSESIREGFELGAGGAEQEDELQYFASHRIVLEREASSRDERIAQGRIILRRGRYIEQVVIRRGTPGVAVDWGEDFVAVSFEEGTAMVFERETPPTAADGTPSPGSPPTSSIYRLRTTPGPRSRPVVDFDGRGWMLMSSVHTATLQVKRNAAGSRKKSRRVLRGRRLD